MDLSEKNIRNITDYFRAGCKERYNQRIGIEIEHFVIKEGNQNASYEEVAGLMKEAFFHERCYYEKNALISVQTLEYIISLEPAAQLEISINPKKSVEEIERVYNDFLDRIEPHLKKRNMRLLTYGYQPYAKAGELPLIPKKRYEYMDAYFKHTDTQGIRMMRGSASTQIAIDYINEFDFVRKFQLAQMLSPVLYLLCENTPVVEKAEKKGYIPRAVIWNHVDNKRCGIIPRSMDEDFSFHTYAEYVYHVPLIFVENGGNPVTVGEWSAAEVYREQLMSEEEIEHMLSMVFPDVRLKNYIEIRMADSLPKEKAFAYARLIRDIFYEGRIADIRHYLGNPTEAEIAQAKKNVIRYGKDGMVYGRKAGEIFSYLQQISREPMLKLLEKEGSKE